ncbi:malate dehydrogenase (quinone) [Propionivibrio limicola]|uniref:malate dehydrogenase (quinone) n=1 Tax=Propionivibrio limicola TaxID=167645 RepID=UPI001292890A|nr:malate dehydrogenase (quinone) [Propionivibrio limicola]
MSTKAMDEHVDVVMIGGGIASATMAGLMNELMPDVSIRVFERLGDTAIEASQVMNNAGTGHAANCELNYTPEKPDGSVDISKALAINESFEISLQFWARLVEAGRLPDPTAFLNPVPHISFVEGENDVRFLRARYERMSAHPMFADMEYTTDRGQLAEWAPLVMEGRASSDTVAATRVRRGTDLDFGILAGLLFDGLKNRSNFALHLNHHVHGLKREKGHGKGWRVFVKNQLTGETSEVRTRIVIVGAGGGALLLLQKAGIPEAKGYGGFPVSGQWLLCQNPEVIARHRAKVYGKAPVGAPPMSVPHLDTRIWNGQSGLLFGPFAGFTTKYLKEGSYLDLPRSLRLDNLKPMLAVARDNWDLTRYLFGQVVQSPEQRLADLQKYMPGARLEDWKLQSAGKRVQIVKRDALRGGRLEFGTEIVASDDNTLVSMLGASPGASTAAATMLGTIFRCFPDRAATPEFQANLQRMLPSYGHRLTEEPETMRRTRDRVNTILGLEE